MTFELTQKEALLFHHAVWLVEGFLDLENHTGKEFKAQYGFTLKELDSMLPSLREKFSKSKILNKQTT